MFQNYIAQLAILLFYIFYISYTYWGNILFTCFYLVWLITSFHDTITSETRRFNAAFTRAPIISILSRINSIPRTDTYFSIICSSIVLPSTPTPFNSPLPCGFALKFWKHSYIFISGIHVHDVRIFILISLVKKSRYIYWTSYFLLILEEEEFSLDVQKSVN